MASYEDKWLLRKASGARSKHKERGSYAAGKQPVHDMEDDALHMREAVGRSRSYLDTGLVKRWLHGQKGRDFDQVYSEFLTRIQPKYLDEYRDCIFEYVQRRSQVHIDADGVVWGQDRAGKPIRLPYYRRQCFYVHPESNELCVVEG